METTFQPVIEEGDIKILGTEEEVRERIVARSPRDAGGAGHAAEAEDGHPLDPRRQRAPRGFLYAVKASRFLTHMKKLKDPDEPIARFFDRARHLGRHLGPILYQLPPNWPPSAPRTTNSRPRPSNWPPASRSTARRPRAWAACSAPAARRPTRCTRCCSRTKRWKRRCIRRMKNSNRSARIR